MADILILEDEFILAWDWADALHELGHKTQIVVTATEAIAAAHQTRFDVIITDIFIEQHGQLVADGGTSLISKIRNSTDLQSAEWRASVPIIAVTGSLGVKGGFDPLQTAHDLGANLVLRKPFPLSDLIDPLQNKILKSGD